MLRRPLEPGFGRREILGVALFSQLDEPTVHRRVVGFCRRQLPLCSFDCNLGLLCICARAG
jgi:hypothetical protein